MTLSASAIPNATLFRHGKVREVYEVDAERLLLVASENGAGASAPAGVPPSLKPPTTAMRAARAIHVALGRCRQRNGF